MFHGEWELHTSTSEKNVSTQKFWRKVLNEYTNDNYIEFVSETDDGDEKIIECVKFFL